MTIEDKIGKKKIHIRGLISRYAFILIIIAIAVPALLTLVYIVKNGVNVLYWDEWSTAPFFDKLYTGHFSFADLFALHNEHRVFFPYLIIMLLGVLTHYNTIIEMYFSWFLLCIIVGLLFKVYTQHFGISHGTLAKFIPVPWLIFSLGQWENLLWGNCLSAYMMVLFFLLSIYFLETKYKGWWRLPLSIISGVISTFSLAEGLLVWPIGIIMILWKWVRTGKKWDWLHLRVLIIWCVIGTVAYIIYFIGYIKPASHPSLLNFIYNPVSSLIYLLAATGSPFGNNLYFAGRGRNTVFGFVYIRLYLYYL